MAKPSHRAVVFDRDGVLTHFDMPALAAFFAPLVPLSVAQIGQRWQRFCDRTAAPRDMVAEAAFWARFWRDLTDEVGLSVEVLAQLEAFDYTGMLRPHDDAAAALRLVRARGLRVGVLSNFPLASIVASLAATGLLDLVDVACSAAVIGVSKPAAAAYQHVAERLGVRVEECLFIDDEVPCVAGARAAGMDAYYLERNADPSRALPAGTIASLHALPQLLGP